MWKELLCPQRESGLPYQVMPGQCSMLSLPVGEGMFSCTWQEGQEYQQYAIKRVGLLTGGTAPHRSGAEAGLRGPYGNGFPVEASKGQGYAFYRRGNRFGPFALLHQILL